MTVTLEAIAGLWVDAIGRACRIAPVRPDRALVTVAPSVRQPFYERAGWCPRTADLVARWRGDRLVVEAGVIDLGPTYELVPRGDELDPEVGLGLYDDYEDDRGVPWAFPISAYRRATAEELRIFEATRSRP